MHLTLKPRFLLVALAAASLAAGCADDPNVPLPGVPGQYHATAFTTSDGGPAVNLLALGASFAMVLFPDHTTSGRLFIPAEVMGGNAIDESLAGSWRQSNDTVYFDGPADTFVRDVPFVVRGASLEAEYVTPGGEVAVTLSKYGID
jgi:hypothetical protein